MRFNQIYSTQHRPISLYILKFGSRLITKVPIECAKNGKANLLVGTVMRYDKSTETTELDSMLTRWSKSPSQLSTLSRLLPYLKKHRFSPNEFLYVLEAQLDSVRTHLGYAFLEENPTRQSNLLSGIETNHFPLKQVGYSPAIPGGGRGFNLGRSLIWGLVYDQAERSVPVEARSAIRIEGLQHSLGFYQRLSKGIPLAPVSTVGTFILNGEQFLPFLRRVAKRKTFRKLGLNNQVQVPRKRTGVFGKPTMQA